VIGRDAMSGRSAVPFGRFWAAAARIFARGEIAQTGGGRISPEMDDCFVVHSFTSWFGLFVGETFGVVVKG
jgi:hypothetical protein